MTALMAGTLEIPIKIRLHAPRSRSSEPSTSRLLHHAPIVEQDLGILEHLLGVFEVYLAAQYPGIDCRDLGASIQNDSSPGFLLNCVAAASAR